MAESKAAGAGLAGLHGALSSLRAHFYLIAGWLDFLTNNTSLPLGLLTSQILWLSDQLFHLDRDGTLRRSPELVAPIES